MTDDLTRLLTALLDGKPLPGTAHYWSKDLEPVPMEQLQEAARDWRDGQALRRLRETTHAKGIWHLEPFQDVWVIRFWDARHAWTDHIGSTIAEAADKCREALDGD